jgi:hypothetical protein
MLTIVEVAADARKMSFCYSRLCGTASDAADVVRSAIPKGFEFLKLKPIICLCRSTLRFSTADFRRVEFLESKKILFLKIWNVQFRFLLIRAMTLRCLRPCLRKDIMSWKLGTQDRGLMMSG